MVTTRRQSGKLPPPLIPELDHDWDESEVEDTLHEGPSKRPRMASKEDAEFEPKAIGRRGRSSRLAALPSMPLDVLYEVFSHLHPLDLLRVSRTNKDLRRLLYSRRSTSVWKSARRHIKGFPDCPDDLSEPHYARLAFEPSCHACGKSRTFKIDWVLRIRACQDCLRSDLVWSAKFEKWFPDFSPAIMDLLPYSKKSSSSNGHDTKSRFFWKPAILNMAERLEELEDNIMLKEMGAVQALENFRGFKEGQVPRIFEHARLCEAWAAGAAVERSAEHSSARSRRKTAIFAKLRELNWSAKDIAAVEYHTAFEPAKDLTDRVWTRIRPELESRRLVIVEQRRQSIIEDRRRLATTLYESYKFSVPFWAQSALPSPTEVHGFAGFAELIESPTGTGIQGADFANPIQKLPLLIAQWAYKKRQEFLSLLPISGGSTDTQESQLELATSVLKCNGSSQCNSIPIFCCEALAHTCPHSAYESSWRSESPRVFAYWPEASAAIRNIVLSLKLDPGVATCKYLDRLDPRLQCLACPPTWSQNGKQCRHALCWRSCISHFLKTHTKVPEWQALTSEEAATIKAAEGASVDHHARVWYCNICPVPKNRSDLRTHPYIDLHVHTKHGKMQAVEGVDICRDPSARKIQPKVLLFGDAGIPPTDKIFICKHCPHSSRRFIQGGVRAHLRDKHNILSPTQPGDYASGSV